MYFEVNKPPYSKKTTKPKIKRKPPNPIQPGTDFSSFLSGQFSSIQKERKEKGEDKHTDSNDGQRASRPTQSYFGAEPRPQRRQRLCWWGTIGGAKCRHESKRTSSGCPAEPDARCESQSAASSGVLRESTAAAGAHSPGKSVGAPGGYQCL